MMNNLNFYFLSIILVFIGTKVPVTCTVLELNEKFPSVSRDGMWLVMFYAPWCGHCKKLEPTWIEVGAALRQQQPDVKVARLDATKFNAIASYYKIKGFPTIKFLKNGLPFDYNGDRNVQSITAFVNRAKKPPITHFANANSLEDARQNKKVFFLFVGARESTLGKKYVQTANILFTRLSFYTIQKSDLPANIKTRLGDTILVFKDERYYEIPESHESNIAAWLMMEQFPTYNHLTDISFHQLRNMNKRFAIAVLNKNDPFNVTMQGVAYKRTYPYTFCWVEGVDLINTITYGSISLPNLVVYDDSTRDYFVMRNKERPRALTKANVERFFGKIASGDEPALGGKALKEQAKRAMGDVANFFFSLFNDTPILGVVIVTVPTILIIGCCVCMCTLGSDDANSDYGSEDSSDMDEDEVPLNPEDIETSRHPDDPPSSEGLRQRVKASQEE